MDDMKLYSKENRVNEAGKKIKDEFSKELDRIYSDIWIKVKKENTKNQASFVVNQEKTQVSELIYQQIGKMEEIFGEKLCQVWNPENQNERAYSHSQAVIMWQFVAAKIKPPELEHAEIKLTNVSEKDVINDVLTTGITRIVKELEEKGLPKDRREQIKRDLEKVRKEQEKASKGVKGKKGQKQQYSEICTPLSAETLETRKKDIKNKFDEWIGSICQLVLEKEPIL